MSKTPWTPGPWRVRDTTMGTWVDAPGAMQPNPNGPSYPRQILEDGNYDGKLADARLIAVAPEMADVLERAERHMVAFYRAMSPAGNLGEENAFADNDQVIREIRALLARIRGDAT